MSEPSSVILKGSGSFELAVVGESHYQEALEEAAGGRSEDGARVRVSAALVLEDGNPYDAKAVRVDVDGQTVGYLSRRDARTYRVALARASLSDARISCAAQIRGGWDRGPDDRGSFGIVLDLDLRHLTDPPQRRPRRLPRQERLPEDDAPRPPAIPSLYVANPEAGPKYGVIGCLLIFFILTLLFILSN
jgi:hypothetical protein